MCRKLKSSQQSLHAYRTQPGLALQSRHANLRLANTASEACELRGRRRSPSALRSKHSGSSSTL
eukprot:5066309-Pleurochrysis_carterae.AAC.1